MSTLKGAVYFRRLAPAVLMRRGLDTRSYGRNLLENHHVTKLSRGFIEDADLILPMDRKLYNRLGDGRDTKVQLFNAFFLGEDRDIDDPFQYNNTPKAFEKYTECLHEIRSAIERPGNEKLIETLA
jgi:protein-tyrosine-phosphatase